MEYLEMMQFLETHNKTHEEMNIMWDYCVEKEHALIAQLHTCGKRWSDLNVSALGTLEREYLKLKKK
jgi:hypothetical protein